MNEYLIDYFEDLFKTKDWQENFVFINSNYKMRNGANCLYNYILSTKITDGVKEIADKYECYWFLDNIVTISKFQYPDQEFLVWYLFAIENEVYMVVDDGNNNILIVEKLAYSDFSLNKECNAVKVYFENGTVLLPEER